MAFSPTSALEHHPRPHPGDEPALSPQIPDHRDHCLSEADKAAGKDIALCVSRALSDKLVIELY